MTTIVAIVDEETVHMGADSAVMGYNKRTMAEDKLFRVNNMLIGYSGMIRHAQVVRYRTRWPVYHPGDDPMRYLSVDVADALRQALNDAGALKRYHNEDSTDLWFILGFNGGLYEVGEDLSVISLDESFLAVGSGSDIALGSLHTTETLEMPPEERLELALEAASEYDPYTGPPFKLEKLEP